MATENLVVFGDCRGMKELRDSSIHLVITSPPYYNARICGPETISYLNDLASYLRGIQSVFSECFRVLEKGRVICVNLRDISNFDDLPIHVMFAMQRAGFEYCEEIVWNSDSEVYERTLVFRKGRLSRKQKQAFRGMRSENGGEAAPCRGGPVRYPRDRSIHPDMLSEELVESLIHRYSTEGETVLDPFIGNGVLAKAASASNRRFVGYDDNPYSLHAIKRKLSKPDGHLKVVFQ